MFYTTKRNIIVLSVLFQTVLLTSHAMAFTSIEEEKLERMKLNLLKYCKKQNYNFSNRLKNAYIHYAKKKAFANLYARKQKIPSKFIKWIDADPIVKSSVYGIHSEPSLIIEHLYALYIDLGFEKFSKYPQLMLAEAIVNAKQGLKANLKPRRPIKTIRIGEDPRIRINTRSKKRKLDKNDHIINFLNYTKIKADVVAKRKLVELKYDKKGIAIPEKKKPNQTTTKIETRTITAADVIERRDLQVRFNRYMRSKGFKVDIDCGDKKTKWFQKEAIEGEDRTNIRTAFELFKTAYEQKGYLPKARDPQPTPGEDLFYIIRNYEYLVTNQSQYKQKAFPLTAPWPFLTLLTMYNQPLREREERWLAYRDRSEYITYGEYIGGIAQQFDMQSARRLTPYPFSYGTIQMMIKDGGVCGTMANMGVRSMNTIGIPAVTAGQPGHCALISMSYNPEKQIFEYRGGQYATGGHEKTYPHDAWMFGKVEKVESDQTEEEKRRDEIKKKLGRKPMAYHLAIAFAVNYNFQAYLDSMIAHGIFELLPEDVQKKNGPKLLMGGLKHNPFNLLVINSLQDLADSTESQIKFWLFYNEYLSTIKLKPGYDQLELFLTTIKHYMYRRLIELPLPTSPKSVRAIAKLLEKEKCTNIKSHTKGELKTEIKLFKKYKIATGNLESTLEALEKK